MTTPLEAYMTGAIFADLIHSPLPDRLHPHTVTDDQGQVNGIIELHTPEGRVALVIAISEPTHLHEVKETLDPWRGGGGPGEDGFE